MTKIFISHSVKDNDFARQLAQALTEMGVDVWIDLADIPAGMKWSTAVQNGLNECDVMIVIITPDSMASNNVEDEWQYYFDKKKKVFPVRWKPAEAHFQLSRIQYVDFHMQDFATAFTRLTAELHGQGIAVVAVQGELHEIRSDAATSVPVDSETKPPLRVEDILPPPFEWIEIPGGKLVLERSKFVKGNYLPVKIVVDVPTFAIAKYPVTNAQFAKFIDAGGYPQKQWWTEEGLSMKNYQKWTVPPYWYKKSWNGADYPVVVSLHEAVAFCNWLKETAELPADVIITLPTEQQWQRAAQGDDGRIFPWGNTFDKRNCNSKESNFRRTTPVQQYEGKGDSPFGVVDMGGNVWEWTRTIWALGSVELDQEATSKDFQSGRAERIVRGGAFDYAGKYSNCLSSVSQLPLSREAFYTGFRLVLSHAIP
jgi:formylglycine-generating enzyme required for sulfatase activity